MKAKKITYAIVALGTVLTATAGDILWLRTSTGHNIGLNPQEITEIRYADDTHAAVTVGLTNGSPLTLTLDELRDMQPSTTDGTVAVALSDDGTEVFNPLALSGVDVTITGAHVVITAATGSPVTVSVTGSTADGQVKVYGTDPVTVALDGASITNGSGSAINLQTTSPATLRLSGQSTLSDSKKYTTPEGEGEKGTIYAVSDLTICGTGSVSLTAIKKHAITSEGSLTLESGTVSVTSSASDGIHAEGVTVAGGSYTSAETVGDGIDASAGTLVITGGQISCSVPTADTKGLKADADITMTGGDVTLDITGDQCKGFKTKTNMTLSGGSITATASGNAVVVDGDPSYCTVIKADGALTMTDGSLHFRCSGMGGKCMSADGTVTISGGTVDIACTGDGENYTDINGLTDRYSSTCISVDGDLNLLGGTFTLANSGSAGKCIKCDATVTVAGADITGSTAGDAVVVEGDPTYPTVIKADGDFEMTAGSLYFRTTGKGGKGVSADGSATFSGGTIDIACSGDGEKYTNTEGADDTYSSTCVTVDGNLNLLGGTFTLANSGTAGKCLKADVDIIFGAEGTEGPTITASTSGAKLLESGSTTSGSTGGRPGGGGGFPGQDSADYSNPKVVKADGNLTVWSGHLNLSSTQDGGEGLESKNILTINGGDINISTVDDCINATSHIQINGGVTHCIASGNDAIDSNGTITITGGTVIACGAKSPEEGIDCDSNTFTVTGGVIVGLGGASSKPTASKCTQRCVLFSTSLTKGNVMTVCDPSGAHILSFEVPVSLGTPKVLISSPGITTGTHKVYTGGSVEGGNTVYELTTGATYTPGTQKTTFTTSTSMVTGS